MEKTINNMLTDLYIKNVKYIISKSEEITQVFKSFDDKVINKRLTTAIGKVLGSDFIVYNVILNTDKIEMEIYFRNRCICLSNGTYYLPENTIYFHLLSHWCYGKEYVRQKDNTDYYYIDTNGNMRLQADYVIKYWENLIQTYKRRVEEIDSYNTPEKIKETKEELQRLRRQYENYLNDIPMIIRKFHYIDR